MNKALLHSDRHLRERIVSAITLLQVNDGMQPAGNGWYSTDSSVKNYIADRMDPMDDALRDVLILKWKEQARLAAKKKQARNLYVITLDPDVLWRREFRQQNPGYIEGMPCVYVGMTIHEPGERFRQHKVGYRSSKYPRVYGIELAQELMEGFDGTGLVDGEQESALADWLRDQGFAVWQN